MHQILSESAEFGRRYDKNILAYFYVFMGTLISEKCLVRDANCAPQQHVLTHDIQRSVDRSLRNSTFIKTNTL